MPSPEQGDVIQQYSCRCHNITINAIKTSTAPVTTEPLAEYQRVLVPEDGISITHHYLTMRTRNRAQESKTSPNKLLQHLALSCLACKTLAYRVAQELSPGAEAREGPVIPTEDWVEQETLRSKSGWIEVFMGSGGCLVGRDAIEKNLRSMKLSHTFAIGILSHYWAPTAIASSPFPQPWPISPTDDTVDSHTPLQILPTLPPLFPPPPFTPSHPVFISLSACAITKSADLRQRAEEEARAFVKSKLDALEREEAQLRAEVEAIWRGYRDGWKEVLGRVNEERRRFLSSKPEGSLPTSNAKPGVPISIRDFSPIVRSHPEAGHSHRASPPPSTSLLSASLIGNHFPTSVPSLSRSPGSDSAMSGSVPHSSLTGARNSSIVLPSLPNGTRLSDTISSISAGARGEAQLPGAFKRNMDTNVDIASSVAWAQGEEEMRRRFGADGERKERARKRTSKNLGIGAVETVPAPSGQGSTQLAFQGAPEPKAGPVKRSSSSATIQPAVEPQLGAHKSLAAGQVPMSQHESSVINGVAERPKRRVTFEVQPEVAIVQEATRPQSSELVAEVELFDIDDPASTEPFSELDLPRISKPARPLPINRTPSYKLRPNDGASVSRPPQPASLPVSRAIPRSPAMGGSKWIAVSARRSVGLADALPLLSSSVPAGDRLVTDQSQEVSISGRQLVRGSPPLERFTASQTYLASNVEDRIPSPARTPLRSATMEPAEAELKHLLAASAPSHRHAWKEGGRAWQMFHQRSQNKKKLKGTIAEEGSDGIPSSLDDSSDISSDHSPYRGQWRNPSHFANSLPVQIRPIAQYQPNLEPKTSLTDKQGVLVPPLKVTNSRSNSATAIRKAVYAERDRTRSIDPGPTLDFNEEENEEEEDDADIGSDGDRGRRHALSILQARSIIPEAGMWRSMAS